MGTTAKPKRQPADVASEESGATGAGTEDATPAAPAAAAEDVTGALSWESALDGQPAGKVDQEELAAAAAALDAGSEAEPTAGAPAAATPGAGELLPPRAGRPGKDEPRRAWSERRIRKASTAELRKRVAELQAMPAPVAAAVEMAPLSPQEQQSALVQALAPTFGMVGSIAGRVLATRELDLSPDECNRLANAWAPLLTPYMQQLAAALPWAVALGESYNVLWPKVERVLAARQNGQEPNAQVLEPVQAPGARAAE